LIIEKEKNNVGVIKEIKLNGKKHKEYFISHEKLVNGKQLKIIFK
jgi:putative alpha-1,2-mannosidase